MPISIGDTVKVKVFFFEEDTGDPVDPPEGVTVEVFDSEQSLVDSGPAESGDEVGEFFFIWEPEEAGLFLVRFTGAFGGDQNIIVEESFLVSTPYTVTLGEGQELVFATVVDPLFVDPEEFKSHFVEAHTVEIMEFIYRYSTEVQKLFQGKELPFIAHEYIRAAVLCSLSKIYDYGVGGDESSVTLGDLAITSRTYPRLRIDRANAANWCELAAALRWEMTRAASGMKAIVKGTKYTNPMPKRKLRDTYAPKRGR